ncbi:hypothetical protein VTO42DRAFT_5402 [Malbranchea cinnamomea]
MGRFVQVDELQENGTGREVSISVDKRAVRLAQLWIKLVHGAKELRIDPLITDSSLFPTIDDETMDTILMDPAAFIQSWAEHCVDSSSDETLPESQSGHKFSCKKGKTDSMPGTKAS